MDKYEYKIKAEQIKKLADESNYISAMKIADTVDWKRVKNVSMLCMVSDIYGRNEKYEESHELLLMAYDRSPIGRIIVYKLAELAIKMEDFDEAVDYYKEFLHLSPSDPSAELLRYKICKAKGVDVKELIPILEGFKDKEYHEEWAYELARLYHEAGMSDKCIQECDDIILWFSEGKYVEKAMELKMLYRPLTATQQDLYDHRNDLLDEIQESTENKEAETKLVIMEDDAFENDIDVDDIKIATVNFGKYDTLNLQAELAKNMQEIMSATEKQVVDNTLANLKRMVEDSPFLDMDFDDDEEEESSILNTVEFKEPEIPEAYMSLGDVATPTQKQAEKKKDVSIITEEDGQLGLFMPDSYVVENQITGQMRIEDVLNEWERVKTATEHAIKENEQKRLDEAKAKALSKAEKIMAKLNSVINEEHMSAAKVNKAADILENVADNVANNKWDTQALNEIAAALEAHTPEVIKINTVEENVQTGMNEHFAKEELKATQEKVEEPIKEASIVDSETVAVELMEQLESELFLDDDFEELDEDEQDVTGVGKDIVDDTDIKINEDDVEIDFEASESEDLADADMSLEENDDVAKLIDKGITADISESLEAIIAKELEGMDEAVASEEKKESILTEEQESTFSAFLSVRGVEKALEKLFEPINKASAAGKQFEVPNIAIAGKEGMGKTTLALEVVKAIQIAQHKKSGRVAKIKAMALNKKDVASVFGKMVNGVLIIEKAGELSKETIRKIMQVLQETSEEIAIVIEDDRAGVKALLEKDLDFASSFKYKIELPEYNNDELVEFGKVYADSLMYVLDDMAVLALYTCIGNIYKEDDAAIGIDDVNDIIDEAVRNSNNKRIRKLKNIVMSRRYDDDGKVILFEEDFDSMM